MAKPVAVLFVDLDGTVRHGPAQLRGRFVNKPDDVIIFPQALDRLREWRHAGGRIVAVSNQGGIAMGHMTDDQCSDVMERTQELVEDLFDVMVWCRHHPSAAHPEDAQCWGRKPLPGLILEGLNHLTEMHEDEFYPPSLSRMVGDGPEDELCAARAGVGGFIWADQWRAGASYG